MEYLKINGVDFSPFVSGLVIGTKHNYTKQTNAAGNSVIDYINTKHTIDVKIISTKWEDFISLYDSIKEPLVAVEVLNQTTNGTTTYTCLLPSITYDFYTIQNNNIRVDSFNLSFAEV